MEKLLTTKQVADIFNVDARTVTNNFIRNGLEFIQIGAKDYRYELKDVEKFKEELKRNRQKVVFLDNRTELKKKQNKKLRVV